MLGGKKTQKPKNKKQLVGQILPKLALEKILKEVKFSIFIHFEIYFQLIFYSCIA